MTAFVGHSGAGKVLLLTYYQDFMNLKKEKFYDNQNITKYT